MVVFKEVVDSTIITIMFIMLTLLVLPYLSMFDKYLREEIVTKYLDECII